LLAKLLGATGKLRLWAKARLSSANAQHPDNHGKWFARPDHFAKTFPFKETIIQFYFFCKIDRNNQQDFLKNRQRRGE